MGSYSAITNKVPYNGDLGV